MRSLLLALVLTIQACVPHWAEAAPRCVNGQCFNLPRDSAPVARHATVRVERRRPIRNGAAAVLRAFTFSFYRYGK